MENKVKFLRLSEEYGLTQQELAEALGVSRQTIIEIEKGKAFPSGELVLKISRFFNRDARDIF